MAVTDHCFLLWTKGQGKIHVHVQSVLQFGIQTPLVLFTTVLPFLYNDCQYIILVKGQGHMFIKSGCRLHFRFIFDTIFVRGQRFWTADMTLEKTR